MWILALDVGTSSVRAIGYDEAGRPLPGVDARTAWEPATTTDGGAELDPEALVVATASAIDRSLSIEASSRGAALLGLAAVGAPAPAPEQPGELLRPDPRRGEVYARARQRQARLYGSVVAPRGS